MKTFPIAIALTLLVSPFCMAFQYETFLDDKCVTSMGIPVSVNPLNKDEDIRWTSIFFDGSKNPSDQPGSKGLKVLTDGDPKLESVYRP
jgi:hypothetical protein